jgi:anti-sigma factor RsiW
VGSKMNEHVSQLELDAYVIGALDDADVTAFEAHVVACEACAKRLQHEAELEVAFAAVVASPVPSRLPRIASISAFAGAALAMAAATLLWLAPRAETTTTERTPSMAATEEIAPPIPMADASTFTASLDVQADGSRLGVRD